MRKEYCGSQIDFGVCFMFRWWIKTRTRIDQSSVKYFTKLIFRLKCVGTVVRKIINWASISQSSTMFSTKDISSRTYFKSSLKSDNKSRGQGGWGSFIINSSIRSIEFNPRMLFEPFSSRCDGQFYCKSRKSFHRPFPPKPNKSFLRK